MNVENILGNTTINCANAARGIKSTNPETSKYLHKTSMLHSQHATRLEIFSMMEVQARPAEKAYQVEASEGGSDTTPRAPLVTPGSLHTPLAGPCRDARPHSTAPIRTYVYTWVPLS